MEINCTKHTVTVEELLHTFSAEVESTTSVILPAGRENSQPIKCSLKVSVTSTSITDKKLMVEGPACVSIICLDDENRLFSVDKAITFSKAFETDADIGKCEICTTIDDEHASATVGEGGKLDIKLCFNLQVSVKKPKVNEVVCDIDGKNIEQLPLTAGITVPRGRGEKNLILEEEISVGNGQPSVDSVIRYKSDSVIEETKIVGNKVMVKGMFKLYVLYLPIEGTRPQAFQESYPFSQIIEVDGITENCRVHADSRVVFCELVPRPDIDGDLRNFTANIKLSVWVKAWCDDDIPLISDAFSTDKELSLTYNEINCSHIKENVTERFIARKELEFSDGAIGSVIDMWCENKTASCRFEEGQFKICGTIVINLLAYDCDGVPNCYERPVDFEYMRPIGESEHKLSADYRVTVMNCSYTITGANTISVAVEPLVEASVYETQKFNLITDAVLLEDRRPSSAKSGIILYFADAGESIWNIARRYNSSVAEIKELNGVTDDILPEGKKFLIPTK